MRICEYCRRTEKEDLSECLGCGAPLPNDLVFLGLYFGHEIFVRGPDPYSLPLMKDASYFPYYVSSGAYVGSKYYDQLVYEFGKKEPIGGVTLAG